MTSSLPQGRTLTRLQHREKHHHASSPLSFRASMSSKISSASGRATHRMQETDATASSSTIIRHATSSNMTLRNKTPQQGSAILTWGCDSVSSSVPLFSSSFGGPAASEALPGVVKASSSVLDDSSAGGLGLMKISPIAAFVLVQAASDASSIDVHYVDDGSSHCSLEAPDGVHHVLDNSSCDLEQSDGSPAGAHSGVDGLAYGIDDSTPDSIARISCLYSLDDSAHGVLSTEILRGSPDSGQQGVAQVDDMTHYPASMASCRSSCWEVSWASRYWGFAWIVVVFAMLLFSPSPPDGFEMVDLQLLRNLAEFPLLLLVG
ncbi:hypothetical protein Nepgr_021023 [Nepenthes gracilis]|uniref:Uncharacterized protein n=1 Tax=Nepenthes gracilis TaxID=150966 RepID=A0AAD3XVL0_NEPGR|nr:hypothetical protein Nepgr_021023 [Nepenthes gracilis]